MTSIEKGHALELAVQQIETVILSSSPSLRGQPFQIERRKIITVGDVHHEIDVFVSVGAAKGYKSVFLFECKNWADPVGKNEIIVFAEKIDIAVAQRGYFVAKQFTKDAVAQAARDARISLLYATEHDPTNVPPPNGHHLTAPAAAKVSTTFRVAGTQGTKIIGVTPAGGHTLHLPGGDVALQEYLNAWLEELYAERLLAFWTADLPEGIHSMMATDERSFNPGELVMDGREIDGGRLDVEFGVEIIRPAVISDYEVATRGRVIRLATARIRNIAIDTSYVTSFSE
jgi:restriction endonuclease